MNVPPGQSKVSLVHFTPISREELCTRDIFEGPDSILSTFDREKMIMFAAVSKCKYMI